jgi:hypothetical protein
VKLLPFRRTKAPKPPVTIRRPGRTSSNGPTDEGGRPSDAEIRQVLGEVSKTLADFNDVILTLEFEIDTLHERTTRQNQYILSIVQALLRAGVDLPLTSKEPSQGSPEDK